MERPRRRHHHPTAVPHGVTRDWSPELTLAPSHQTVTLVVWFSFAAAAEALVQDLNPHDLFVLQTIAQQAPLAFRACCASSASTQRVFLVSQPWPALRAMRSQLEPRVKLPCAEGVAHSQRLSAKWTQNYAFFVGHTLVRLDVRVLAKRDPRSWQHFQTTRFCCYFSGIFSRVLSAVVASNPELLPCLCAEAWVPQTLHCYHDFFMTRICMKSTFPPLES